METPTVCRTSVPGFPAPVFRFQLLIYATAEDNPANDYPDEDLDFDDEYDDVNAAYCRFRYNASDDEEFDVNDYEYGYQGDDSDEDGMRY